MPSFSFAATANAVRLVGAEPVFVDIEPRLVLPRPGRGRGRDHARAPPRSCRCTSTGTRPRWTGSCAIAERHGLAVVEDAAQAHGAALDGRPVGAFGTAGCFSFYPTKNMHSLEGGMVTTDDAELARTLRLLRNQGMEQRYANEIVGANMRMTDVAAAIGRVQLQQLPAGPSSAGPTPTFLDAGLTGDGRRPPVADGARHVYHQYTIRVPGRPRRRPGRA